MSPVAALLGGLLACAGGPPAVATEAATYAALVGDPAARDPAACAALADPDLAADCAVVVAQRTIAAGAPPEAACAAAPAGPWRDECFFLAAEGLARAGAPDAAAALCRAVRAFPEACAQHLWDPELAALWQGDGASWASTWEPARALQAAWAARLGPGFDLDDRYWRHWIRYGLAATGDAVTDPVAFCAARPPAVRRACEKATRRAVAEGRGGR